MKIALCLLLAALTIQAASITVIVKNDAGATVSTTVVPIGNGAVSGNTILTAMNSARLADFVTPGVLRYPTIDSFFKAWVRNLFMIGNSPPVYVNLADYLPSIIEARRLADVAKAARDAAEASVVP